MPGATTKPGTWQTRREARFRQVNCDHERTALALPTFVSQGSKGVFFPDRWTQHRTTCTHIVHKDDLTVLERPLLLLRCRRATSQVELTFGSRTLGPSTMGAPEYIGNGAFSVGYTATKVGNKEEASLDGGITFYHICRELYISTYIAHEDRTTSWSTCAKTAQACFRQ